MQAQFLIEWLVDWKIGKVEQNKKAIVIEMALKVVAAGGLEPPTKGL